MRRLRQCNVRVTTEAYERWTTFADELGMSLASLVRRSVESAVSNSSPSILWAQRDSLRMGAPGKDVKDE